VFQRLTESAMNDWDGWVKRVFIRTADYKRMSRHLHPNGWWM